MKILHINSYYSGSIFYKNLYDNQINQGLSIDVFVPVPKSFDSSNLTLGDYTKISENHGKYDRFFFQKKHKKIYKDILLKYKLTDYSLIHAHSLFTNGSIALKVKEKYGIPYIVAVRNTDVNVFFKYMIHLRRLGIQILKEASRIIFLSESYKYITLEKYVPEQLKEEILEKSEVIPNGIDEFWFRNIKTTNKKQPDDVVKLLYVGVINKNKNVLTTVKAIDKLKRKGINATLTVVGKIEDYNVYRKILSSSNVYYKTPRPKEELIKIYRSNDIFVMPSITESFGLVYAEAMSQAMPVIYSEGQGFDKQFEEGEVGYHVRPLDSQDLADKILMILKHYRNISNRCIKNVDRFNWDLITMKYLKVYNHVSR